MEEADRGHDRQTGQELGRAPSPEAAPDPRQGTNLLESRERGLFDVVSGTPEEPGYGHGV